MKGEGIEKWAQFLGRKMALCLLAMLLLTGALLLIALLALVGGSVATLQSAVASLWTAFCTAMVALAGTATAGNVFEHREKTKQGETAKP